MRFEVASADGSTRLVIEHRNIPADVVVGYGAGWHAHLDWLEAQLAGKRFDFWPRYRELRPLYEDAGEAA